MGDGPHDDIGRRRPDPGARYVRAFLSHGLRREGSGVCRCLHGGDQLAERGARVRRPRLVTYRRRSALTAAVASTWLIASAPVWGEQLYRVLTPTEIQAEVIGRDITGRGGPRAAPIDTAPGVPPVIDPQSVQRDSGRAAQSHGRRCVAAGLRSQPSVEQRFRY